MNHKKKETNVNKKYSFYSIFSEVYKNFDFVCQISHTVLFWILLAVKELAAQGFEPEYNCVEKGFKPECNCEYKGESSVVENEAELE